MLRQADIGQTCLGTYAADPASIGIAPLQDKEARGPRLFRCLPRVDQVHTVGATPVSKAEESACWASRLKLRPNEQLIVSATDARQPGE
jgi:hypothetical protein